MKSFFEKFYWVKNQLNLYNYNLFFDGVLNVNLQGIIAQEQTESEHLYSVLILKLAMGKRNLISKNSSNTSNKQTILVATVKANKTLYFGIELHFGQ